MTASNWGFLSEFAWCFQHGRLHHWGGKTPWCTTDWLPIPGGTKEEALLWARAFGWEQTKFIQSEDMLPGQRDAIVELVKNRTPE